MKRTTTLLLIGASSLSATLLAKDIDVSKLPPPSERQNVTYERDIKPILDNSCIKCHGTEKKPKGKLRLDSLEGIMKGGEDGKVVEPGKSAKSMMIINVGYLGDEDDWMPPPRNKAGIKRLTSEQIGLMRAWIDQGAK